MIYRAVQIIKTIDRGLTKQVKAAFSHAMSDGMFTLEILLRLCFSCKKFSVGGLVWFLRREH